MVLLQFTNLITVLAIAVGLTSAIKSSDNDVENLRKHLAEIRAITDEAHNPCFNFTKFACGNFQNASEGYNYPKNRVNVSKIAEDLKRLENIKLDSTKKAKDFLESCINDNNPKNILQKINVFKDPTKFRLEKTLGFLKTSGYSTILKAFIEAQDEKKVVITIYVDRYLFLSNQVNEEVIKRNLELMEVNPAERDDAEKKIAAFIQKGKSIVTSSTKDIEIGFDIKALKNFDWDEYVAELKQLPELSQASIEFVLRDVVNLQKIIDLAHETEPQILRLVTAFELMAKVIDTGCTMVVDFFNVPLFAELYHLYFTQTDQAFYLDVFKEFENSYRSFQPRFLPSREILFQFEEKRRILESVDQILMDGKEIDGDYKEVLIEKDNFYQNFLNLKRYLIQKDLSRSNYKNDQAEAYLFSILNPVNINKPVFYHFASQGHYLWQSFFRENAHQVDYSYSKLRNCLNTQRDRYKLLEYSDSDYFEYVDEFVAMKQTYVDFKRYWNKKYDSAHKLDYIFNEFHLTSDQAFFLNIAQKECARVNNGNNIPFRVLLNMKDVSKAFSCPVGSLLNIEEKCSVWEEEQQNWTRIVLI